MRYTNKGALHNDSAGAALCCSDKSCILYCMNCKPREADARRAWVNSIAVKIEIIYARERLAVCTKQRVSHLLGWKTTHAAESFTKNRARECKKFLFNFFSSFFLFLCPCVEADTSVDIRGVTAIKKVIARRSEPGGVHLN
jgi:hypothetical protein